MTTAFRNWLGSGAGLLSSTTPQSDTTIPDLPTVQGPDDDDDDGEATEREDDDDRPAAFPALNSAQRTSTTTSNLPIPTILTGPVPSLPNPSLATRNPSAARVNGNSLMLPPTTLKPPTSAAKKGKVALAPGFGPLDWASLKSSGADLRKTGHPGLLRIPPSELKQHRTRDDCWSAFNGKVYNITEYLPYHQGGEKELLRVAGRDGTKLFMSTHAWVNAEYMLDACLIGFLVSEPTS